MCPSLPLSFCALSFGVTLCETGRILFYLYLASMLQSITVSCILKLFPLSSLCVDASVGCALCQYVYYAVALQHLSVLVLEAELSSSRFCMAVCVLWHKVHASFSHITQLSFQTSTGSRLCSGCTVLRTAPLPAHVSSHQYYWKLQCLD